MLPLLQSLFSYSDLVVVVVDVVVMVGSFFFHESVGIDLQRKERAR